jgi:hypothetical protein
VQKVCERFFENLGNTILSPLKYHGHLKLVVVMILVPLVLNAINFWIIDNILKFKEEEMIIGNITVKELYTSNREKTKERGLNDDYIKTEDKEKNIPKQIDIMIKDDNDQNRSREDKVQTNRESNT